MALPAREAGDERLRIGCVHGSTFDIPGYQTNFPISRDAGVQRGLDYLAIGDTHSFRDVTENLLVPTVYPGAPEPTGFDDRRAGHVALVAMFRRGLRPRVDAEKVAFWRWIDVRCRDMNELRNLLTTPDLDRHVVRLHLDMTVSLVGGERSRADPARPARYRCNPWPGWCAGGGSVWSADAHRFRRRISRGFPPVLKDTVARLDRLIAESTEESERAKATRALAHLYKLLQSRDAIGGRGR